MSRTICSGPNECFETGSDHQFQIPFRQNRVGIFPVENLALFGDANVPGKTSRRLRKNRRVSRPAAATNGPAPTMEESQLDVILFGSLVQLRDAPCKSPKCW